MRAKGVTLGNSYQGLWANLYHYNETTRQIDL
ncbi:unknown [Clostridium sp. CAG:1013]|nr:unknown [Clostridium sp. CAG:1013]